MSDTTQLMLIVECVPEAHASLEAAFDQFDVPCVLIVPQGWQPFTNSDSELTETQSLDNAVCQSLVALIQNNDAAAIVANDAALAKETGADGCQLDVTEAVGERYHTARSFLGGQAIVGALPGPTRHAAMTLAEAGADYIGYAVLSDDDDMGADFVAWWSEIFESPVVAFTDGDPDTSKRALEAGPPDFLAVPVAVPQGKGDSSDHLGAIARLIEEHGQLPIAEKNAK
jgi:thiamine-phosphate pyrophosphorylase